MIDMRKLRLRVNPRKFSNHDCELIARLDREFLALGMQSSQADIVVQEKCESRFLTMDCHRSKRAELRIEKMIVDLVQKRWRHCADAFGDKLRRKIAGQTQSIGESDRASFHSRQRASARNDYLGTVRFCFN